MMSWVKTPWRWLRAIVLVSVVLSGTFSWQLSTVPLAAASMDAFAACCDHAEEDASASQESGDRSEEAPCDCGSDCHCCFACAHHGQAATVLDALPRSPRLLSFVEIPGVPSAPALSSIEGRQLLKVPKSRA